jgi:hypothetical protein
MVITMVSMRMMQVPIHDVIDVIAVRHRLVPAARTMNMTRPMPTASVRRCAAIRIRRRNRNGVLFHRTIPIRVMKMPVVNIVHVSLMLDLRVATTRAVLMIVPLMTMLTHRSSPSSLQQGFRSRTS